MPRILIVTGAHPAAEAADRPIAYRLRGEVIRRLPDAGPPGDPVLVCSDLWYLNNENPSRRPTISVGGPRVNALTAYLGGRIPAAFAIDGELVVQMDLDLAEPAVCCWGSDAAATGRAVDIFVGRYLDHYLSGVDRFGSA
jgi:hypothetical protein